MRTVAEWLGPSIELISSVAYGKDQLTSIDLPCISALLTSTFANLSKRISLSNCSTRVNCS